MHNYAILDSGERIEFETGAVRDISSGKGRFDLMPSIVIERLLDSEYDTLPSTFCKALTTFKITREPSVLIEALRALAEEFFDDDIYTMLLEVAKHFEEGAKKYGEHNWQKGIPEHSYIDSAYRHYIKHRRGDDDEPHDRAAAWNIMCLYWTVINIDDPKINDISKPAEITKTNVGRR